MDPARLVFPGFTVGKQDPREAEALVRLGVGGFCLYRGTPKTVAALTARLRRLAKAYLAGLRAAGALGCLKHFPGHGSTTADSHLDLPTVNAPLSLLSKRELAPFKALARGADAVMLGHLVVPALDPSRLPFTLS